MTEHRQEESWDEISENIEKPMKNNDPATSYSIIRHLEGRSRRQENVPVQDKSCELLVNSRDTLKHWPEFFCESLNVRSSIDRKLIDQIQVPILARIEEHRQNLQPSIDEVRKAMNQIESRKGPGSDEVTVDIMKAGGEPGILCLSSNDTFVEKHFVDRTFRRQFFGRHNTSSTEHFVGETFRWKIIIFFSFYSPSEQKFKCISGCGFVGVRVCVCMCVSLSVGEG